MPVLPGCLRDHLSHEAAASLASLRHKHSKLLSGVSSCPCSEDLVVISLLFPPAFWAARVGSHWQAQPGPELWLHPFLAWVHFFGFSGSPVSHLLKGGVRVPGS